MKVIADFGLIPLGVGLSLSEYIARCEKVLQEAGLKTQVHANGTNIAGEWDAVVAAVKRCHQVLHEAGVPRINTVLKLGTRVDRDDSMEDKVRSVNQKLRSL